MIPSGWHPTNSRCCRALLALGAVMACAPARLHAQTISSAVNQVFHVADASTTISPITVADPVGGNIRSNRDIHISIPAGFNMTWDASVLTATITGSAAARVSPIVAYTNGNLTVTINVLTSFAAGDQIVVSGLKFTGFTATSPANNLQLSIKNNPGFVALDNRTIQIDPRFDVSVTPASTSITSLPTNGVART